MRTRNLIRLAVPLCVALAMAGGGRAEAAFDVSTSIFSVTGATNVMAGGGVSTYNVAGPDGGEIITLTDFSKPGNTSAVTPAESISLSGNPVNSGSIQVTLNIIVTNPSGSANFLTFREIVNFNISGGLLIPSSASIAPSTPTQQTLNGTTFTISNPSANIVLFGQPNPNAITALITPSPASVPEPASITLMGLGLIVAGGVALRRRRTR